jgi:hypothetical protein
MTPQAPAATVKRPVVERVHRDLEALALLAAGGSRRGHLDVLEEELAGRAGPDAELVLGLARGHPGPLALDDDRPDMPLCPAAGSVFATTSWWSATVAYEIQFFCPFRTMVSASGAPT